MDSNQRRAHFFQQFSRIPARPPGPLQKILAILIAAAVFTVALMVSVFLFAAALTVGVVAGGYLWWKSRGLRKRMRERKPAGGLVIEGEVIREVDRHEETGRPGGSRPRD